MQQAPVVLKFMAAAALPATFKTPDFMTRLIFLFLSFFLINSLQAQTAGCREKLDSAYKVLSGTSSFRAQVTGEKKKAYDELLTALRAEADQSSGNFGCFQVVARLFDPIHDNHLDFYEKSVPAMDPVQYGDKNKVAAYRALPVFRGWPVWKGDVAALEKRMMKVPADSIEGLYYFFDQMKIAVVRTVKKDSLVAVVLDSKIPFWKKGELVMVLREYAPFRFRALCAQPFARNWNMVKNEKMIDGTFTETMLVGFNENSRWMKNPSAPDFRNLPSTVPECQLRWLDSSTQYLRLGNFRTNDADLARATGFYDSIAGQLTATRLVVDLRNNGGGGFRNSRRVLNQLEKYAREKKIYAIVNNRTVSNAEQFLVLLKFSPNVMVVGEATNGKITYGSNEGKLVWLPGHSWVVYPTDTKEAGKVLQYEDVGVQPQVLLRYDSDWIGQVLDLIR
ncbi:MAG: hypothetical protein EOO05_05650 [Chitinophagaceae bacterium]|nr:MAG: hypothetical protein EOO05_05650 [Chitinophagaceae bacterium]